ncbi:hypothetical protein PE36_17700 [Moritella sp. PE36]|uniref:DUF3955 domain-containing protein n=1 Tax=Moritella sp. PE36 TaxID=58051 RepID=UPI00015682BD|nr:DUF3955 domain-containing protein [Moritella sp. PE36]EDM67823.1 hypothetical protein PE36_17700 [Moritella sp. PE36]
MLNKLLLSSIVLFGLGFSFLFLENTFFQYIDEEGVLHESLFLPFGVIGILSAAGVLFIYLTIVLIRKVFK